MTLSIDTLPPEIRLQIFSYLLPRTFPIRLGHNPSYHAVQRMDNPLRGSAKTFPDMNRCTSIIRVCRLFDQEFTPELYRRSTFSVENTTASVMAGTHFFTNTRPSTTQHISRFLIFHHTMESEEQGYKDACAGFRRAAGRISLSTVRITVTNPRAYNLVQFISLLRIENVRQFVVRLDSVKPDRKDELYKLLDNLNRKGIKATSQGYTYRPAVLAPQSP